MYCGDKWEMFGDMWKNGVVKMNGGHTMGCAFGEEPVAWNEWNDALNCQELVSSCNNKMV